MTKITANYFHMTLCNFDLHYHQQQQHNNNNNNNIHISDATITNAFRLAIQTLFRKVLSSPTIPIGKKDWEVLTSSEGFKSLDFWLAKNQERN